MNLYEKIVNQQEKIAVIGLGYVGLPLAVAFSKKAKVIGFDLNAEKIKAYRHGFDINAELEEGVLQKAKVDFTTEMEALKEGLFFVVAVPTPVTNDKVPDLKYVRAASLTVGKYLRKGAIVVYESTVYPGVTEEVCVPLLESESGLTCGIDFKVAYSPERINPGDPIHKLENIIKIVSGMDEETLEEVAKVYELVIEAGVHRAESIKVAEAAKVIENAQRDINIAFMNELSMLFKNMEIDTKSVLEAAGTKWNFLKFTPGLVGGHCIGIDPYYLTYKAEGTGYHSKIILAGRRINDGMGKYIAQQIVKILVQMKADMKGIRIGFLGLTYKENCSDIRNTKVIDVIQELTEYGIIPVVTDPRADRLETYKEYGIQLVDLDFLENLDVVVLAVPHEEFIRMEQKQLDGLYAEGKCRILVDIKGRLNKEVYEERGYYYWRL